MKTETLCLFPEAAMGAGWLKRFEEKGIPHGFVPKGRGKFADIRTSVENYEPVVFHSHFVSYDFSAVILKLFVFRHAKVVWHLHSPARSNLRQRRNDLVKVRFLARSFVDRAIAVGDGVYDNALARGFDRGKLALIHNGIDVSRFQSRNGMRQHTRESLGVAENQLVYLLLGWDPYRKGVDLFAKATNQIAKSSGEPDLFLVVGEKVTRDFVSNLPASLRLGLRSALRIIDPIEDFASFLSAVDVVVSASRGEGLPYAVLEGMAAGKLVLSSDIPGAREAYGDSRGVWLFPVEDWMTQATCMKAVRELPTAERQERGEANSRYVTEHYSLSVWAEKIGCLYQEVLK